MPDAASRYEYKFARSEGGILCRKEPSNSVVVDVVVGNESNAEGEKAKSFSADCFD